MGAEQAKEIVTSYVEDEGLISVLLEIDPHSYSVKKALTYTPCGEAIFPIMLLIYTPLLHIWIKEMSSNYACKFWIASINKAGAFHLEILDFFSIELLLRVGRV